MDSCSRVGLLFDDIVASVEVVNSQNVQLQCTGRVPTVAVDKTDGIQVGNGMRDIAGAAAEPALSKHSARSYFPCAGRIVVTPCLWRGLMSLSKQVPVWRLRLSDCSCLRLLMWLSGMTSKLV